MVRRSYRRHGTPFLSLCRAVVLIYANAGHNPPFLIRKGCPAHTFAPATGTVLAIIPGTLYDNGEETLAVGDLLALYTDGVTEAFGSSTEQFGEERLAALLTAAAAGTVGEICATVIDTVEQYRYHEHQDDVTVLLLRRVQ